MTTKTVNKNWPKNQIN